MCLSALFGWLCGGLFYLICTPKVNIVSEWWWLMARIIIGLLALIVYLQRKSDGRLPSKRFETLFTYDVF